MNLKPIQLALALLTAASTVAPQFTQAASDTWNKFNTGTYSWNQGSNWLSGTQFPNGVDDVANINVNITNGNQTINLNQPITVGTLNLGDSATNGDTTLRTYTINSNAGAAVLTFRTSGANAILARAYTNAPPGNETINPNVVLSNNLTYVAPWVGNQNGIVLNGVVSGSGGIAITAASFATGSSAGSGQLLDLVNTANSFAGDLELANGTLNFRGSVLKGQNSALGNSTNAVKIGSANTLGGTGTPSLNGQNSQRIQLVASDDTSNYAFTRDLDFSQTSGSGPVLGGRETFAFNGNGGGGANVNTLTIGGVITLCSDGRGDEFIAQRQGMTIYFTNAIYQGSNAAGNIYLGPISPGGTSVDGPVAGTYRFSDTNRTFANQIYVTDGTLLIEGSVAFAGNDSPIGWSSPNLADGNGGNIAMANAQEAKRAIFLATPGASFDRSLSLGGGLNNSTYNGGTFNVYNGYQLGGMNTNGTVTFTGNIFSGNPNTGANPTNQAITVGQNLALIAATGGTVDFQGLINDTAAAEHVTRVTINQARNHPQLDANSDGIPDPGVANALVGTATGGTVILSGYNSYEGTTEILGGTLTFGPAGYLAGSTNLTVTGGTLLLPTGYYRISPAATVNLGGSSRAATIALSGDVTESVDVLMVGGTTPATIDFGAGTNAATVNSTLHFANSSAVPWANALFIRNWIGNTNGDGTGTNQLYIGYDNTGLTPNQLASIAFINPAGFPPGAYLATQLPNGEVVPTGSAVDINDTWNQVVGGTYDWNQVTNWVSGTDFPNRVGAVANVNINISNAQTINLQQTITVGTLNLGDAATTFYPFTISSNALVFDVFGGSALLARTYTNNPGGVTDVINSDLQLNDPLTVSLPWVGAGNGIQIKGQVTGAGGLSLVNPSFPIGTSPNSDQRLELFNANNSYTGTTEVGNGVLRIRASVPSGANSPLGNATTAVKLGNASSVVGTGTPSMQGSYSQRLECFPADDTSSYTFARDLDMSGGLGSLATAGRAALYLLGDGAGGANSNILTISGNIKLPQGDRGTAFLANRQGQTIYFTGNISTNAGIAATANFFLGVISPDVGSVDGPAAGTYRFSNVARNYTAANQYLTSGTIIIEGDVPGVGTNSPIGQPTIALVDGNGGNIAQNVNAWQARRAIYLATAGTAFNRVLTLGGGLSQSGYNGTGFTVFPGYQFGGLNTSGTVTFPQAISSADPNTGSNPTNQVITLGQNIALIQATGGTAIFSGVINDTPSAATVTRVTINQVRNHSQIDGNQDGIPDPGVANAVLGTATGGTVQLNATNTYQGTTEVLGGTLVLVGSVSNSSAVLVTAGTLLLTNNPLNLDRISNSAPVTIGGGAAAASIVLAGTVSETAGVLNVIGTTPSTIDFGTTAGILKFAASSAVTWSNTVRVANWSGNVAGAGTDQLFIGSNTSGLTANQLTAIVFINPAGFAAGTYAATQLSTGEIVPTGSAIAISDTWNQVVGGTFDWNQGTNWLSGTAFPNRIDAVANVNIDINNAQTINLNQTIAVGTLNLGDATNAFYPITIASNGGALVFDVSGGNALLARTSTNNPSVTDVINANVQLIDPLTVRLPWSQVGNGIQINGLVSGPGGINLVNPSQSASAQFSSQFLDLVNVNNSYTGSTEVGNGSLVFRGNVPSGANSALGNSTSAIKLGNASTLVGSGTPTFASQVSAYLTLQASDDSSSYTFARDLNLSGATGSAAAVGRAYFTLAGDNAGGANSNSLTLSGNITLPASDRGAGFLATRAGQTIYLTGGITTPAGGNGPILWGPIAPDNSVDGPVAGTYKFSNVARAYTNTAQYLTCGTILIEGSVPGVGTNSPIGTQTINLQDGNGGNIAGTMTGPPGVNAQDGRRAIFLATPGATFARALSPGGGLGSTYNGGNFNVYNGYEFGGVNTSGKVTFSGNISSLNPATGNNPTNQVITLGQNLALIQATGGTAEFTGVINDTPNTTNVTRVTINQFRHHSQIDMDFDGIPDGVANTLAGAATGGTVILSATNTYEGGTEVLGGTLLVNNTAGSGTGSGAVSVQANATLGGTGSIAGAVTFNSGSHAVLTQGALLTLNSALTINGTVDVHLNLPVGLGITNSVVATYNPTGSSGTFQSVPVIDSGSLAPGTQAAIITSGGTVVLQVTAAVSTTPPSFPPGGISVLPSGNISLTATGAVGTAYRLWASTNVAATPILSTWTLLSSGTITASPFTITDLTATNHPQRFYLFSTP